MAKGLAERPLAIEPPLLVWEDADLSVAATLEALVRSVPPALVQHGAIVVHDARGSRVLLAVERTRGRWLRLVRRVRERVVVEGVDVAPVHGDLLAARLGAWLDARGVRGGRALPLCEQVKRAAAFAPRRGGGVAALARHFSSVRR
ncbi:MAG: hypothetical protein ACJ79R_05795 [Anaeromyxobacteraceae bacterium]